MIIVRAHHARHISLARDISLLVRHIRVKAENGAPVGDILIIAVKIRIIAAGIIADFAQLMLLRAQRRLKAHDLRLADGLRQYIRRHADGKRRRANREQTVLDELSRETAVLDVIH